MHQNLFAQSLLLGIYVVHVHFENFSGECSTYRGNHLTIDDSWTKSSCLFMDPWARGWEWEGRASSGKVLSENGEVPQPRSPIRRDLRGGIWVRNVGMCVSMAGWGGEKENQVLGCTSPQEIVMYWWCIKVWHGTGSFSSWGLPGNTL